MISIQLEEVVQTFYEGLEEGKTLGRKRPLCGNVEFPPAYACNQCGNYETQWHEISGGAKLHSTVFPATLSSKPEYKNLGKYVYGEVELEGGSRLNAAVRGIGEKNRKELSAKLPPNCHVSIFQREGGYKTVVFDLDQEQ